MLRHTGTYQASTACRPRSRVRIKNFVSTGKINFEGLVWAYFTAYYEGNFVDRIGGKLSKPSIGMKIPNETITSAVTVGIEALYDYALVSCGVRNPIVFTLKEGAPEDPPYPLGKVQFETKDHAEPTFVRVIQQALGNRDKDDTKRSLLPMPYRWNS